MKLQRAPNDDIVTVRFAVTHWALAEAQELKGAGFGQRVVTKDFPGEWSLIAQPRRDFDALARPIPVTAAAVGRVGWARLAAPLRSFR
jgi:hypothetical protein